MSCSVKPGISSKLGSFDTAPMLARQVAIVTTRKIEHNAYADQNYRLVSLAARTKDLNRPNLYKVLPDKPLLEKPWLKDQDNLDSQQVRLCPADTRV